MGKMIYVVVKYQMPVAAFHDKADAIKFSIKIGGPGDGHAIGFVTIPLYKKLEEDTVLRTSDIIPIDPVTGERGN